MDDFVKKEAEERIFTDIDCNVIFDKLLKRGVDERLVFGFKSKILMVPGEWDLIKNESVKNRKKRRVELACKIKLLSDEIENDVDAVSIRIYDENSIFTDSPLGTMSSKPTVSNFLCDLAEYIEKLPISEYREVYETSRPIKKSIKTPEVVQYAKRRVFQMLKAINVTEHGQNKDTATLVNSLFDLCDLVKVTANDISQMRKHERKKYYIDKE